MKKVVDANIPDFKGYNGSNLIKRQGVEVQWTPELVQEFAKCLEDPIYFTKKYIKIINVDRGLINLDLYPYQENIITNFKEENRGIITMARQSGKTTSIVACLLWYIIFHKDKLVAVLANKASTSRKILASVKLAYEHLPKWLQHGVVEWNKSSMMLENNSGIIADATTGSTARGWSFACVIIDEAAHIDNWDEFYTSVYPTISSGKDTKLFLISTPNGLNHFHKLWQESIEEKNEFTRIEVSWEEVPGRDNVWYEKTIQSLSYNYEKFAQEYENRFIGSSGTLIDGSVLQQLRAKVPVSISDNIKIYDKPDKEKKYVMVADCAEGKGLDYSVATVFDVTHIPYKQVAVYRSNLATPYEFSFAINSLSKSYNALVLVENNNMGSQVTHILHQDMENENLLSTKNNGREGKVITAGFSGSSELGLKMTKPVRTNGCSILKMLIEQGKLVIQDQETIIELTKFSLKKNVYRAEAGAHDDIVMTLVIFAWMSSQTYFEHITNISTINELRKKTDEELLEDLRPVMFVSDGEDENSNVISLTVNIDSENLEFIKKMLAIEYR